MHDSLEPNMYFTSLVLSLSRAAMAQMGKISNPVTGKVERNLLDAKMTIDMMEMLKEKTKGNLSGDEQKLINNMLADLQLNFADEAKKDIEKTAENKQ